MYPYRFESPGIDPIYVDSPPSVVKCKYEEDPSAGETTLTLDPTDLIEQKN